MKTLVCDYHLNDPTFFQHHQIQVCSAHARMLALGSAGSVVEHPLRDWEVVGSSPGRAIPMR